MSRTRRRPRRAAITMSLDELDDWIVRLNPSPLIDGVSMLDGYLAAIIVGPSSIDPHEWLRHMLGPHGRIGSDGSEQAAAIGAIVARFNAISEGLAVAPERYAPIFERTDAGTVLAGPWCMGFVAAMNLRLNAWRPLCDLGRVEHGLLLPILLHCTDDAAQSVLGPVRSGPEGQEFLANRLSRHPGHGAGNPSVLDAAARPSLRELTRGGGGLAADTNRRRRLGTNPSNSGF
jgi:uncharacterized protein